MAKKTVLSLFESRGGVKIDEARLSAPLVRKVAELDAMLSVLDHLKGELLALKREARRFRTLFLSSFAAAILGLILGSVGLVEGVLGALQVVISLTAALALFVVEFYVMRYQRITRSGIGQRSKQIQSLSSDLEVRLDHVYDAVYAELSRAQRPASFGKHSVAAKLHAKRGD